MGSLLIVLMLEGITFILLGLLIKSSRLMCCLMMMESLSVLVLFSCLMMDGVYGLGSVYITLLVIFTMEMTVSLCVLTRLWSGSGLIDMVGV